MGSKLPPLETGTVWKVGSDVEVAWALKAWHGGGYGYRLCEVGKELDEECFQSMHLDFVGNSSLRWGGIGGETLSFDSEARGWQVANLHIRLFLNGMAKALEGNFHEFTL